MSYLSWYDPSISFQIVSSFHPLLFLSKIDLSGTFDIVRGSLAMFVYSVRLSVHIFSKHEINVINPNCSQRGIIGNIPCLILTRNQGRETGPINGEDLHNDNHCPFAMLDLCKVTFTWTGRDTSRRWPGKPCTCSRSLNEVSGSADRISGTTYGYTNTEESVIKKVHRTPAHQRYQHVKLQLQNNIAFVALNDEPPQGSRSGVNNNVPT